MSTSKVYCIAVNQEGRGLRGNISAEVTIVVDPRRLIRIRNRVEEREGRVSSASLWLCASYEKNSKNWA